MSPSPPRPQPCPSSISSATQSLPPPTNASKCGCELVWVPMLDHVVHQDTMFPPPQSLYEQSETWCPPISATIRWSDREQVRLSQIRSRLDVLAANCATLDHALEHELISTQSERSIVVEGSRMLKYQLVVLSGEYGRMLFDHQRLLRLQTLNQQQPSPLGRADLEPVIRDCHWFYKCHRPQWIAVQSALTRAQRSVDHILSTQWKTIVELKHDARRTLDQFQCQLLDRLDARRWAQPSSSIVNTMSDQAATTPSTIVPMDGKQTSESQPSPPLRFTRSISSDSPLNGSATTASTASLSESCGDGIRSSMSIVKDVWSSLLPDANTDTYTPLSLRQYRNFMLYLLVWCATYGKDSPSDCHSTVRFFHEVVRADAMRRHQSWLAMLSGLRTQLMTLATSTSISQLTVPLLVLVHKFGQNHRAQQIVDDRMTLVHQRITEKIKLSSPSSSLSSSASSLAPDEIIDSLPELQALYERNCIKQSRIGQSQHACIETALDILARS